MNEPDTHDPFEGFPLLRVSGRSRPRSIAGQFRFEALRVALGTGAVLLWRHRDEIITKSNRIFFWVAFGGLVVVTMILALMMTALKVTLLPFGFQPGSDESPYIATTSKQ
jgi:hypothetical protein